MVLVTMPRSSPSACALVLVDIDVELRRVLDADRPDLRQPLVGRRHAQHDVARLKQLVVAQSGGIDQFEIEAGRIAQFLHGRRHDREDQRIVDLREIDHGARGDVPCALFFLPGRTDQSLSGMKARPRFCPWPE